ncbi:MAG: LysM peptidoglycan-binding domain-containing protein [Actinomycetota bacterium]|nr:LysM peptidoglycan-binding domain-containing protein [Actinomycetota bacterium]
MRAGSRRRGQSLAAAMTMGALVLVSSAHYTVRRGDSLWEIGARHCLSVKALVAANNIRNPALIYPGQRLVLPASAGRGPAQGDMHRVCPGENLTTIAARHGVSLSALVAANHISDRDYIQAGQLLAIPEGAGATPPPRGRAGEAAAPSGRAGESDPSRRARSKPRPASATTAEQLIDATARRYGWDPALVKALAWQESGWKQHVVSRTGAVGIMQVQPGTGAFVSRRLVGRKLNLSDPADNVLAGVVFLDHLHDLTGGDMRLTLAGYYQGLASVRNNGWYPDTVRYVDNVLQLRRRYD